MASKVREEVTMKIGKKIILKEMADWAYVTAKKEANSVCHGFFHQPVLPEKVKKLRKW